MPEIDKKGVTQRIDMLGNSLQDLENQEKVTLGEGKLPVVEGKLAHSDPRIPKYQKTIKELESELQG